MDRYFKQCKLSIRVTFLWVIMGVLPLGLAAQSLKLDNAQSKLTVTGTSSLHDWEEVAEQKSGSLAMDQGGENPLISSLSIAVEAESLKSGKSGMDKNTYKALNTDKHKEITFKLDQVKSIVANGSGHNLVAVGQLTISGKTNTVEIEMKLSGSGSGDHVTLKGSKVLKFTDFGLEPPKALMGTIKTGDEIVVHFDTVWKK